MKKQLFLGLVLALCVTGLQAKTITVKNPKNLKNMTLKVGDVLALTTFIKGHFSGSEAWYEETPLSRPYFKKGTASFEPIKNSSGKNTEYNYVTTPYTASKAGTVTIIGKTGKWDRQKNSEPTIYKATITIKNSY